MKSLTSLGYDVKKISKEQKMILQAYSVKDSVSGVWSQPLFFEGNGSMIRSFTDIVNDKNQPIGKHPDDYAVYRIAAFDDSNGEFGYVTPDKIIDAKELIKTISK